jgi:hypothetical protein
MLWRNLPENKPTRERSPEVERRDSKTLEKPGHIGTETQELVPISPGVGTPSHGESSAGFRGSSLGLLALKTPLWSSLRLASTVASITGPGRLRQPAP